MTERNPERDWPVIRARQDVLDAQRALKEKPTAFNALELQDKQYSWAKSTRLELVKKGSDDRETT
jgi:hypothetical protein